MPEIDEYELKKLLNRDRPTPGPWHVEHFEDDGEMRGSQLIRVYAEGVSQWVADVGLGFVAEANARLIAAAPDLLAACEDCLAIGTGPMGTAYDLPRALAFVRAAVAKAKGQ